MLMFGHLQGSLNALEVIRRYRVHSDSASAKAEECAHLASEHNMLVEAYGKLNTDWLKLKNAKISLLKEAQSAKISLAQVTADYKRKSIEFSKVEAENIELAVDFVKAKAENEELKAILEKSKAEAKENLKNCKEQIYQDYEDDMADLSELIFVEG